MTRKYERPYDVALPAELRQIVRSRRQYPDGQRLEPTITFRGKTEIYAYPWARMGLGDWFFVPLRGTRKENLAVRFRQVAARKDWELTIVSCREGTEDGLRVSLTLHDVSLVKKKAQVHHGVDRITYSDGKWTGTRKARYKPNPKKSKPAVVNLPFLVADQTPIAAKVNIRRTPRTPTLHIVPEPEQLPVETDVSLSPGYDRDKVIRERLAKLGISQ